VRKAKLESFKQSGTQGFESCVICCTDLSTINRACHGVTAIEYGLIASLVAVAIIGAVSTLGAKLTTVFTQVSGSLT
jgi:pilus assembly protein Flp/PilA